MLLLLTVFACRTTPDPAPAAAPAATFADLGSGEGLHGFFTEALYTDHRDVARGGRFVHGHTGLVLRLLESDGPPAAMVAVGTLPEDDRGTPHTQEHLLLGKGNRGRAVADAEAFQLVDSSAYTERMRTVYHFRTAAGVAGFMDVLEQRLEALLRPDYTDAEIEREVHHHGVDGEPGELQLVEKGTVYAEMARSSQQKGRILWEAAEEALYGAGHPQTLSSGGDPEVMPTLTPSMIRDYHRRTHVLANMSAVVFLPRGDVRAYLASLDGVLRRVQPGDRPEKTWRDLEDLPRPRPTEERGRRTVRYPKREGKGTVDLLLAWPPTGRRSIRETLLLELFLDALAGDASSSLHKAVVDRQERERDTGAQAVWSWHGHAMPGAPVMLGVDDLPPDTDDATLDWLEQRLLDELRTIASWESGDPDLAAFDARVEARLIDLRRELRLTSTEPTGFGTRGTGSDWLELLDALDHEGGPIRSLARLDSVAWVEDRLDDDTNPWVDLIRAEGWLDNAPVVLAARPDPTLIAQREAAEQQRLADALATIRERHPAATAQESLAAYRDAFDAVTEQLEEGHQRRAVELVPDPPLDHDPTLPVVTTVFAGLEAVRVDAPSMGGAQVELVLDAGSIPPPHRELLVVFDALVRTAGVLTDAERLDHDAVRDRLRRETRHVWGGFRSDPRTGRVTYHLGAEGTDLAETRAALTWSRRFVRDSDWSMGNLARLRSLVAAVADRRLEDTPTDFIDGLRMQDDRTLLHLQVGAVRQLDALRIKWRLTPDHAQVAAVLQALGAGRDPTGEGTLVDEARADMRRLVRDLPDSTLAEDRRALAELLRRELRTPPQTVLAELRELRAALFTPRDLRVVVTGGAVVQAIEPDVAALVEGLFTAEGVETFASETGIAAARIAARGADLGPHLAWLDPELSSGNVRVLAPGPSYAELTGDVLRDQVAFGTVAGGGGGSLFMATWGAGLAYSNGAAGHPSSETRTWSATRCPDVASTARFARDLVRDRPITPFDIAYAVAQEFDSDAHRALPVRAAQWASRVEDGHPPATVRAYRRRLLAVTPEDRTPDAWLAARRQGYAPILPGLGEADPDGVWTLVTGDADQLASWNLWLQEQGEESAVRLYPRDLWDVDAWDR